MVEEAGNIIPTPSLTKIQAGKYDCIFNLNLLLTGRGMVTDLRFEMQTRAKINFRGN